MGGAGNSFICAQLSGGSTLGSMGVATPPLNLPYLVYAQKDLSVGFLIFSLRQILRKLCLFSPQKVKFYIIVFKKNSGWNKCTQNAGKCTIPLEDFKKFPGVTPPTPSRAGRKRPAYSGLRPSKGLRFCWTPPFKSGWIRPCYVSKHAFTHHQSNEIS